ncbi:uncharacterized protein LOC143521379 [Brachyhypopomus gauderio]|uniref:uncharacterized protein LOC143521379 n=1 Tax=Brachyhypopomus gauderio TaxID=698409 RepID=UPI0040419052
MTLAEQTKQHTPQVLSVGEKDRKRLLEVYVKRSLSLNDGALGRQRRQQSKWVTRAPQDRRERTHSSISSFHFSASDSEEDPGGHEASSEFETVKKPQVTRERAENKSNRWRKNRSIARNSAPPVSSRSDSKALKWLSHFDKDKRDGKQQNKAAKMEADAGAEEKQPLPLLPDQIPISVESKKAKETKKKKKSSIWKNVLAWFSKGNTDKQEEHVAEDDRHEEALTPPEPETPPVTCLPLSEVLSSGDITTKRTRRQSQRKTSLKRFSRDVEKATGRPRTLDLSGVDHKPVVTSIQEVESTNFYYEKMSEELHRIVDEVKNSPLEEKSFCGSLQPADPNGMTMSQQDVIERIIAVIKQQGDVIDSKLKENPTVCSYLNTLSYGTFQQMADQYVESGVPEQKSQPPVVAPELVKFAFTLDFTARVAGLSRHTPVNILGFGNQYLKDRFTHMTETHPHIGDITEVKMESKESTS